MCMMIASLPSSEYSRAVLHPIIQDDSAFLHEFTSVLSVPYFYHMPEKLGAKTNVHDFADCANPASLVNARVMSGVEIVDLLNLLLLLCTFVLSDDDVLDREVSKRAEDHEVQNR